MLRYNGTTGAFIDEFVPRRTDCPRIGTAFGPDGELLRGELEQSDAVKRYDGTTGAYIDDYVTAGLGGLSEPYYLNFIPRHQVMVSEPTAVELVSFTARGMDGAVELSWETGSEMNNLGFHLYRVVVRGRPLGADHGFVDSRAWVLRRRERAIATGTRDSPNGVTYFYQLEDIETTGKTECHGPVTAVPLSVSDPDPPAEEQGTEPGHEGTEPGHEKGGDRAGGRGGGRERGRRGFQSGVDDVRGPRVHEPSSGEA